MHNGVPTVAALRNCFIERESQAAEAPLPPPPAWNSLLCLVIQSGCDGAFLSGVLALARLNLERLVLGIATALSDDVIARLIADHPDSLK